MNIRKNVDYSEMYAALDQTMAVRMLQMELYCEIGKAVCQRSEKGAAVAAAAYLSEHYPDSQGFSPRNLRRMRDFYRTYEDKPALLALAMQLGWTQNVVILEADLSMELREWYLKAANQFSWFKAELTQRIAANAHETIVLVIREKVCYSVEQGDAKSAGEGIITCKENKTRHQIKKSVCRVRLKKDDGRRWLIMSCLIFREKRIAFMRC